MNEEKNVFDIPIFPKNVKKEKLEGEKDDNSTLEPNVTSELISTEINLNDESALIESNINENLSNSNINNDNEKISDNIQEEIDTSVDPVLPAVEVDLPNSDDKSLESQESTNLDENNISNNDSSNENIDNVSDNELIDDQSQIVEQIDSMPEQNNEVLLQDLNSLPNVDVSIPDRTNGNSDVTVDVNETLNNEKDNLPSAVSIRQEDNHVLDNNVVPDTIVETTTSSIEAPLETTVLDSSNILNNNELDNLENHINNDPNSSSNYSNNDTQNSETSQFVNPFEKTSLEDQQVTKPSLNEVNNNEGVQTTPALNDEVTSISLGTSNAVIPETLDQNFGVIGGDVTSAVPIVNETTNNNSKPDKKEVKEKKVKKTDDSSSMKKSKTLVILIPIIIILGLFGTIGFFGYKLFLAVDPVDGVVNAIKEFGNEYNSMLSENNLYKMLSEEDELLYSGTLTVKKNDKETRTILNGGLSRESKKMGISAEIKDEDDNEFNISYILINNSSFIQFVKDSYYYRFALDSETNVDNIIDSLNLKPVLDNLADIIKNNFNKNNFAASLRRLRINGKKKIVNEYTYTLPANKTNEIIESFLNSIDNTFTRNLINNYITPNLDEDVEITIDVSLKGVELLALTYNNKNIEIFSNNSSSFVIVYNNKVINYDKKNNQIVLKINNKNTDETVDLDFKWDINQKDDTLNCNFDITSSNSKDNTSYNLESELKSVSNSNLDFPSKFINFDSDDAKEAYESDYQLALPYSELFGSLKK